MGENNKKNNEGEKKEAGESKKNGSITVVLKTDLHCEGCASKFVKCIRSIDGVDTATAGDGQKITVVGKVDPAKLREKVEQKTHKKVELISPQPKKDGGEKKESEKGDGKKNEPKDKADSNGKSDQLPVTTAVFKLTLHCDGCIHKIYKTVTKTKGYEDMKIDKQKDLVTVTGAVDAKALSEVLSKQLRRDVEIVPPKKDGGEKKEKDGGGKNSGDEKKEGNNNNNNTLQAYPYPSMPGPGDQINYNPYPVFPNHAPQIFSDENPNACSVM